MAWWRAVIVGMVALLLVAADAQAMKQKRRKTALMSGDILIGALFSVHHQPKKKTAFTLTCGKVRLLVCLSVL